MHIMSINNSNKEDKILEVQGLDENGNKVWKSVSQINTGIAPHAAAAVGNSSINNDDSCANNTNTSPQSTKGNSTNTNQHRKDLPMQLKLLLSPNATVKAHRKENYLYRHSHDKIDTNLMILLHGAGDTHQPFHALAKKMNMPQCASLSIHASSINNGFGTLPFELGHTWFTEMDYTNGQPLHRHNFKVTSSLDKAVHQLDNIISLLTDPQDRDGGGDGDGDGGRWLPERIFLFGFSAGACLAMEACVQRIRNQQLPLGGAICVSGGIHTTIRSRNDDSASKQLEQPTAATPALIIGGATDGTYPPAKVHAAVQGYNSFISKENIVTGSDNSAGVNNNAAKSFIVPAKGHGMIQSEAETRAIMEFCAEHMVRRMVHMEGFCEISPDHLDH